MLVTQKKQYALRAVFELAKRHNRGPVKTSEIAEAQAIPVRFLEVILNQLKRSGLVESKRGFYGGYTLAKPPDAVTAGDVFRMLEAEDVSSDCVACTQKQDCPFFGECVFLEMWESVYDAMYDVYDRTTLQQLVDSEKNRLFDPT